MNSDRIAFKPGVTIVGVAAILACAPAAADDRAAKFDIDAVVEHFEDMYRSKSSIASARSRPEHFPPPYAEGRYLRILWWKSWREKPLTPAEPQAERPSSG